MVMRVNLVTRNLASIVQLDKVDVFHIPRQTATMKISFNGKGEIVESSRTPSCFAVNSKS
jgi:hypothetical protein